MAETSFQTVRLTGGSHRSPDEGVCVMELTSMLADEPFGDHPRSACPVVASFLRTYNDGIDDDRRQDLYEYAAKLVDSRRGRKARRARAVRCRAWARDRGSSARISSRLGGPAAAGREAAMAAIARGGEETHRDALALVDELLHIDPAGAAGAGEPVEVAPRRGERPILTP